MSRIRDLHQKWMQEEKYRNAYAELEPEFVLAKSQIAARVAARLRQDVLEKLEGGNSLTSKQQPK